MKQQLLAQIHNRTASVAVIGLGYVGLPLAVTFAESGFPVIGIDVDVNKVDAIDAGRSTIEDAPSERLRAVSMGRKMGGRFAQKNADQSQPSFAHPHTRTLAPSHPRTPATLTRSASACPRPCARPAIPVSYSVAVVEGLAGLCCPGEGQCMLAERFNHVEIDDLDERVITKGVSSVKGKNR